MSAAAAWRGAWIAAGAAALPLAARCLSYTDRILDRDETYWMASALRMRAADLPVYVAGWDTKPPLIFAFHRLALALSPERPMLAVHVLGALVAAASCALVALAARRLAGDRAGLLAALLFALLDSTGPVRALAAYTELLAHLPAAAVAALVAYRRPAGLGLPFAAGALAAVAFLCKHPAALLAPGAYAAILLTAREGRPWLRSALAGLAGTAAVLGAAYVWLRAAGAWDDAYACNVVISSNRARFGMEIAAGRSYDRWLDIGLANAVAAAGTCVLAALRDARARTAFGVAGPLAAAGLLAAWAGGAALPHYLLLAYVPLALGGGAGIALAVERLPAHRRRAAAIGAAALALLAASADRLAQWRSRRWPGYDAGPVPAIRDRVRALVPPGGTLFVWGIHPDLYVTCLRAPATRFVSCGWLVGTYTGLQSAPEPFEFVPGSWELLFRDLEGSRPACVVDSAPAGVHGFTAFPVSRFPRLDAWLRERYVPEDAPGGYVLWRRRE